MKKLGFRWVTALAAGVIMLASACSDDKTETVYVTNPALRDLAVKPGDSGTIDFTANGNWTITNDSPEWLTLGSSTGAAGKQQVSYTVTDANIAFDKEDLAKVTLSTESGEFSCTITRAAKERTIRFLDGTGEDAREIGAVTIEDNGTSDYRGRLVLDPNFDWKLESVPDWVTANMVNAEEGAAIEGAAGEQAVIFFVLKDDRITTTGKDGEIVITDASGTKFERSLPLRFYGAEPTTLDITLAPQVKFSFDGRVYSANWDTVTEEREVPFSVQGMEDGFQIALFGKTTDDYGSEVFGLMEGYKSWIGCDEITVRAAITSKNYELYVKSYPAPTAERTGFVAILPASIYARMIAENGAEAMADGLFDFNGWGESQTITPKEAYAQYIYLVQQDGPAGMEIELSSQQQIVIEDQSAMNGFTCYNVTAPAQATTVTIRVKLPDEKAGLLPAGMADEHATLNLQIKTSTWIPGEGQNPGHMEDSNIGEISVKVKEGYTPTATEYTLEATIPENTGDYRMAMSQITFTDTDTETTMGVVGFDQSAK